MCTIDRQNSQTLHRTANRLLGAFTKARLFAFIVGMTAIYASLNAAKGDDGNYIPAQAAIETLNQLAGKFVRVVLTDTKGQERLIHAHVRRSHSGKQVSFFDFRTYRPASDVTLTEEYAIEGLGRPLTKSSSDYELVRSFVCNQAVYELEADGQSVCQGRDQFLVKSIAELDISGPVIPCLLHLEARRLAADDPWVGTGKSSNSDTEIHCRFGDESTVCRYRLPVFSQSNRIKDVVVDSPLYRYSYGKYIRAVSFDVNYVRKSDGKHTRTITGYIDLDEYGLPTTSNFHGRRILSEEFLADARDRRKSMREKPESGLPEQLHAEVVSSDAQPEHEVHDELASDSWKETILADASKSVELKKWQVYLAPENTYEARWPAKPVHASREIDGALVTRQHSQANDSIFMISLTRPTTSRTIDDLKFALGDLSHLFEAKLVAAIGGHWFDGIAVDGLFVKEVDGLESRIRVRILLIDDAEFSLVVSGEMVPKTIHQSVAFFNGFKPLLVSEGIGAIAKDPKQVDVSRTSIQADQQAIRTALAALKPTSSVIRALAPERLKAWEAGASKNWQEAQVLLGMAKYYGAGCEQDREKAFQLVAQTAAADYAHGQLCLAWLQMDLPHQTKSVQNLLASAAELGDPIAKAFLADRLLQGEDGNTNTARAMELASQAAGEGVAMGQYICGRQAYENHNLLESEEQLRKAAEAGMIEAQLFLATILLSKVDEHGNSEAIKWFEAAARQGDKQAQLRLSICFQKGLGTKIDREDARHWRGLAIAAGLPQARTTAVMAEIENAFVAYDNHPDDEREAVKKALIHFEALKDSDDAHGQSAFKVMHSQLTQLLDSLLLVMQRPGALPTIGELEKIQELNALNEIRYLMGDQSTGFRYLQYHQPAVAPYQRASQLFVIDKGILEAFFTQLKLGRGNEDVIHKLREVWVQPIAKMLYGETSSRYDEALRRSGVPTKE